MSGLHRRWPPTLRCRPLLLELAMASHHQRVCMSPLRAFGVRAILIHVAADDSTAWRPPMDPSQHPRYCDQAWAWIRAPGMGMGARHGHQAWASRTCQRPTIGGWVPCVLCRISQETNNYYRLERALAVLRLTGRKRAEVDIGAQVLQEQCLTLPLCLVPRSRERSRLYPISDPCLSCP